MNVIDITATAQGDRGGNFQEVEFDLSTVKGCRETYSRILESYATGTISEQKARTLGYLFSNLLPFWKHEADMRIEERIDAIENALEARK